MLTTNQIIAKYGKPDDDVRNVETMKKHFDKKEDNILKTYLTAGGQKKLY